MTGDQLGGIVCCLDDAELTSADSSAVPGALFAGFVLLFSGLAVKYYPKALALLMSLRRP